MRPSPVSKRRPPSGSLPDRDLPTYTVVVALYREAAMSGEIVTALERLDYPRAKLDVHFVVEQDDVGTLRALAARIGDLRYDIIVGARRPSPHKTARTEHRAAVRARDAADGLRRRGPPRAKPVADGRRPVRARAGRCRVPAGRGSRSTMPMTGWLQALYAIDYAALFGVVQSGTGAHGFADLPRRIVEPSSHRSFEGWPAAGTPGT